MNPPHVRRSGKGRATRVRPRLRNRRGGGGGRRRRRSTRTHTKTRRCRDGCRGGFRRGRRYRYDCGGRFVGASGGGASTSARVRVSDFSPRARTTKRRLFSRGDAPPVGSNPFDAATVTIDLANAAASVPGATRVAAARRVCVALGHRGDWRGRRRRRGRGCRGRRRDRHARAVSASVRRGDRVWKRRFGFWDGTRAAGARRGGRRGRSPSARSPLPPMAVALDAKVGQL